MSGYAMAPPRQSRLPALLAAIALHAAVLALVMFTPSHLPAPVGSSVPINIVSSAPFTDTRPAVQAPQTEAAAAPAPVPQAAPQPPAPEVAPPAFTQAVTQPPKVQRPVPAPQPSLHAAAPAAKPFDFNHMQQIIDNAQRNSGKPASSAARGPARPETASQARPDAGQGLSQSDLTGLSQLLDRLWNLQCDVGGVSSIRPFKVTFTVTMTGHLLGAPNAGGLEQSSDPVTASVVRRALDAVRAVEPYDPKYYGQTISPIFDPNHACNNR
jgi:periplasmic protein TonB